MEEWIGGCMGVFRMVKGGGMARIVYGQILWRKERVLARIV